MRQLAVGGGADGGCEFDVGGDLATRIKQQRSEEFSEQQIMKWFVQVSGAIAGCCCVWLCRLRFVPMKPRCSALCADS